MCGGVVRECIMVWVGGKDVRQEVAGEQVQEKHEEEMVGE